jgi:hypothetical protein
MASPPFHDTVMAQAISSGINRKVTCAHAILNGVTFANMSHPSNQISSEKWQKRGSLEPALNITLSLAFQKVIANSLIISSMRNGHQNSKSLLDVD